MRMPSSRRGAGWVETGHNRVHADACRPAPTLLRSALCRERDFSADWYLRWKDRIAAGAAELSADQEATWGTVWAAMLQGKWMHRKLWEWCAIAQALHERGMLGDGKNGMGFAVGQEPLTSLFASLGCRIVASDYSGNDAAACWSTTGQMATSLKAVHWPGLIAEPEFRARVSYQNVDMRDLSALPRGKLDFLWSSCSFEHLGSLDKGLQFVRNGMDCLRPGGIAIHTTEYNVSSNDKTVEQGGSVIYRRKDIEQFDRSLRLIGCAIEALDFEAGAEPHDIAFDYPPYYSSGRQHVKLSLDGHISTSMLLIIRKAI